MKPILLTAAIGSLLLTGCAVDGGYGYYGGPGYYGPDYGPGFVDVGYYGYDRGYYHHHYYHDSDRHFAGGHVVGTTHFASANRGSFRGASVAHSGGVSHSGAASASMGH